MSIVRHGSRWLLASACLLLAACATHQKQLTAEDKGRIREVHLQVVVPQEKRVP